MIGRAQLAPTLGWHLTGHARVAARAAASRSRTYCWPPPLPSLHTRKSTTAPAERSIAAVT